MSESGFKFGISWLKASNLTSRQVSGWTKMSEALKKFLISNFLHLFRLSSKIYCPLLKAFNLLFKKHILQMKKGIDSIEKH